MALEYESFVRKPFKVEAIEVTNENIHEISKMVGTIKYDENTGIPYIQVDRKKVPNLFKVSAGHWVTKVDSKVRAFTANSFAAQFVESDPHIDQWVKFMNGETQDIQDAEEAEVETG